MIKEKNYEIKAIYAILLVLFLSFLIIPLAFLFLKSFQTDNGLHITNYIQMLHKKGFGAALKNSVLVSAASSVITTILAFIMAYSIHYSNLNEKYKTFIRTFAVLPMLLPTVTYGFAMIYSFGKQGLITKLFGRQLFDIYGVNGLIMGYVIYTIPTSFMLLHNTMGYIDKKFSIVSRIMGDSPFETFVKTVLRPLTSTIAASFIQCFFLCFTDFGIPASVGGRVEVIATVLYNQMLGSLPNFNNGAVVAVIMLLPSVLSILVIHFIDKYNVRYNKVSVVEIKKSRGRDALLGVASGAIIISLLSVFITILVVPFVKGWPYNLTFTMEHFIGVFQDRSLINVYFNSIKTALLTAVFGTMLAFGAALVTARSTLPHPVKMVIESIATVTNTIPGMVLGIAYMLAFSGTSLHNTITIMVLCNMLHFFATPYTMVKNTLMKMNLSWEKTARLLGDNWIKTMLRVVIPNTRNTLLEVFQYYVVNAMVTVSAVIFLAGARTMVLTAKIKELQHFAEFNQVFVLSLLILVTNLVVKGLTKLIVRMNTEENAAKKAAGIRRLTAFAAAVVIAAMGLAYLGHSSRNQILIYTNADDEAVEAMKHALDNNGYKGKYLMKSFGTSELGGKLLAEGSDIEADLVTMSSFYLDSAQADSQMFADLTFETGAIRQYPDYYTPITALEGALLYNTQAVKDNNLPLPKSIADLANPIYKGMISITDIQSSSTGWLLVQALVSEYGDEGAQKYLKGIYENAGAHLETSGSGPIKKVRSGEVAIGFGLRHQAVADKASGLPIDYIDPIEGNFTLTESIAVVDKKNKTKELAMEMAECIVKNARQELLQTYPVALYEGEKTDYINISNNPKEFGKALTVELLKEHQALSEKCK